MRPVQWGARLWETLRAGPEVAGLGFLCGAPPWLELQYTPLSVKKAVLVFLGYRNVPSVFLEQPSWISRVGVLVCFSPELSSLGVTCVSRNDLCVWCSVAQAFPEARACVRF